MQHITRYAKSLFNALSRCQLEQKGPHLATSILFAESCHAWQLTALGDKWCVEPTHLAPTTVQKWTPGAAHEVSPKG
eukprot:6053020-Amphidinium_carterae.1